MPPAFVLSQDQTLRLIKPPVRIHEPAHQRKTVHSTRASVLTLAQDAQDDHLIENRQTIRGRRLRIPFLYQQCQRPTGPRPETRKIQKNQTSRTPMRRAAFRTAPQREAPYTTHPNIPSTDYLQKNDGATITPPISPETAQRCLLQLAPLPARAANTSRLIQGGRLSSYRPSVRSAGGPGTGHRFGTMPRSGPFFSSADRDMAECQNAPARSSVASAAPDQRNWSCRFNFSL